MLKTELHRLLREARIANLTTLEGLGEFDLRRPLTPTGTNLLGVVKHLGGMEYGYLGETFGRYLARPVPGDDDPDHLGDMWARADETSDDIVGWYRQACDHADATIESLELDDAGSVPHWSAPNQVTLSEMMLRVVAEELRHGGHLDVARELVGGTATSNTPHSPQWWAAHTAHLHEVAEAFR